MTRNSSTPHAATRITAHHITLRRGGHTLLSDLTLTISTSSRLAIVGENGRGKSTLLSALAGEFPPDAGNISRAGRIAFATQEMPAEPGATIGTAVEFSIRESRAALNALDAAAAALAAAHDQSHPAASRGAPDAAGRYAAALEDAVRLDAWDAERRVTQMLEALGAEAEFARPLAELSVGQRYRVRLACVLGGDAELLLLDEPTNHLDAAGLAALTTALTSRAGGFALVSHDRWLLSECANAFLDLDPTLDGRARLFTGGFAKFQESKRAARAEWEQRWTAQQEEIAEAAARLATAQARLSTGWRPAKGTAKHQRASRAPAIVQSVRRRQAALDATAIPLPEPPLTLHAPPVTPRVDDALLVAEDIRLVPRLRQAVSCSLGPGERLLIRGPNGAGKSTLLGILAGALSPTSGSVQQHPVAHLEHLAQESLSAAPESAAEHLRARLLLLSTRGVITADDTESVTLTTLGLLTTREAERPVRELSVGQQRRLALALCLVARPDVLLLDEPSNHLSFTLVDELTEALQASAAAVVVATHDRALLSDLSAWPALTLVP